MSKSKAKTIGITLGDPCGIGPEVIAKALTSLAADDLARLHLIGETSKFQPGRPSHESAQASLEYLKTAVRLLKAGQIDALVTGPVWKEGITDLGIKFQGHTEFLAQAFAVKKFEMMFVTPKLKTVTITRHIPLHSVSRAITTHRVLDAILLTHQVLQKIFKIKKPAMAVCGLNPHAGEGGTIGKEEVNSIIPAIKKAKQKNINVTGPLAADTLFSPEIAGCYDVVIAMYHDQGIIPVKALYFTTLVNFTIGLPFVRTSPAHGTAFNIAGKNKANPSSMIEAIKLALRLS